MPRIKPYKIKQLPIKQSNINVFQYMYKVKKNVKNKDIQKVAEGLARQIQDKLKANQLDLGGQLMVTQLYEKSLGWQSGGFSDFNSNVKFYDFASEYSYNGDRIQDEFERFNLLIKLVPKAGGCDGQLNDCLWYCLRQIVNNDATLLPKAVSTQSRLKQYLGVERKEGVHIDRIPEVEQKMQVSIHISGDVERRSGCKPFPREATIKLSNGHFTLQKESMCRELQGGTNQKDKEVVMYEEVVDHPGGGVAYWAYDGYERYEIKRETLTAFWMKPRSCPKIYRSTAKARGKVVIPLEQQYAAYIRDAHELFEKSNGLINLFRQLSEKKAALFVFGKLKVHFKEPEPLDVFEARWIHNSRSGGLITSQRIKLAHAIAYDMNKQYSAMLCHEKFTIPMQAGTGKRLSQEEFDAMPFIPYGLYHCRLTNPKGVNTILFSYSEQKSYHSHFSLTTARELGLQITMCDITMCDGGGKANAYLYAERVHSKQLFGPLVERMMDIYQRVGAESRGRCKLIMNCLWGGSLCFERYAGRPDQGEGD